MTPLPSRAGRTAAGRRGQRGFTFNEILVSAAIFGIGMAGVFALQASAIRNNGLATDISVGSNLASSALEQLRLSDYYSVVGDSPCPPPGVVDLECYFDKFGQATSEGSAYFTRTWNAVPDNVNQVTDVTVTVTWDFLVDGSSGVDPTHTISMTGRVYPR